MGPTESNEVPMPKKSCPAKKSSTLSKVGGAAPSAVARAHTPRPTPTSVK